MRLNVALLSASVCILISALPVTSFADVIYDTDIVALPAREVHSGYGKLDLILFGFANGGGVNDNEYRVQDAVLFDGDDANTDMPVGAGGEASESYITSFGDIREFYRTTHPDGQGGSVIDEIVLFVDLSETGNGRNGGDSIMLDTLRIVAGFDAFPAPDDRNDPYNTDIGSGLQNSTGSGFTGGALLASLDPAMGAKMLTVTNEGSGWADYLIRTGINPFDGTYDDETPVLFFWESSDHHGGGTKVFLSDQAAPEPATIAIVAGGAVLLLRRRRTAFR